MISFRLLFFLFLVPSWSSYATSCNTKDVLKKYIRVRLGSQFSPDFHHYIKLNKVIEDIQKIALESSVTISSNKITPVIIESSSSFKAEVIYKKFCGETLNILVVFPNRRTSTTTK